MHEFSTGIHCTRVNLILLGHLFILFVHNFRFLSSPDPAPGVESLSGNDNFFNLLKLDSSNVAKEKEKFSLGVLSNFGVLDSYLDPDPDFLTLPETLKNLFYNSRIVYKTKWVIFLLVAYQIRILIQKAIKQGSNTDPEQCSGMIYSGSGSSFEFSEFRIHADPDPTYIN